MSTLVAPPSARDLFYAARDLAKAGQPVFPCRPGGSKAKAPLTRKGVYDATTDQAKIKGWWKQYGNAAIGIPTGIVYDVLDVDVKREHDGRVHLPYLQRMGLLNGCKRVARTPSGGFHLYFKKATGLTNKASATLGLDVRSHGGYVLAAPSYIETDEYEGVYVDQGETEDSNDDPLMWDLIASALRPVDLVSKKPVDLLPSERRASIGALREWVSIREPGERNNALHWAVCRCIDNNINPHELVDAAVLSGLAEDEVLLTINSAMRRAGLIEEEMDSEMEAMFPALD